MEKHKLAAKAGRPSAAGIPSRTKQNESIQELSVIADRLSTIGGVQHGKVVL